MAQTLLSLLHMLTYSRHYDSYLLLMFEQMCNKYLTTRKLCFTKLIHRMPCLEEKGNRYPLKKEGAGEEVETDEAAAVGILRTINCREG